MSRAIYRSIQAARRRRGSDHDPIKDMERETGIEPATSSLGSWRSTAELLPLDVVRLPFCRAQDNVARLVNWANYETASSRLRHFIRPSAFRHLELHAGVA